MENKTQTVLIVNEIVVKTFAFLTVLVVAE